MTLTFKQLHPHFAAVVSDIDLRTVHDRAILEQIRQGMDEFGVLVFRKQQFSHPEQLAFTERFDGKIHRATSAATVSRNRYGDDAYGDIGNIDENGKIMSSDDRRRMNNMGNRLWHTDASFVNPCGRFSMLFAKVIPPVGADTEFADMRAAHDALDPHMRESLQGLMVFHSIIHSRSKLGFTFSKEERARLTGANQPLIRTIPGSGRQSLHLASHAEHIVGWPVPQGRLLLLDLIEHATSPQFIYRHAWEENDFVIWDNRATMHRSTPFDDLKYHRELIRTTTVDVPQEESASTN